MTPLIIAGDFNAKIGKEQFQKQVARSHTLHEKSSENGILLGQFAARIKMVKKYMVSA